MIVNNTALFLTLIGIFGLIFGSFLNVVIHRLPIMLERDWQKQCLEFLGQSSEQDKKQRYNLAYPASHCPVCKMPLSFWQNIPVLSYLILRGKCLKCKTKIPLRYFFVELFTCALSIIAAVEFGFSVELFAVLAFTYFLIAIAFIDLDHQLLPDALSLPLLWLGLLANCFHMFVSNIDAVLGAAIGYAFFWTLNAVFKFITKKDGMGQGDFKLLAAAGAWLGWQLLPFVVLVSSIFGLIIGGGLLLYKKKKRTTPIPFGPFIAIAMWIAIIWGFDLTQHYLNFFGIHWIVN